MNGNILPEPTPLKKWTGTIALYSKFNTSVVRFDCWLEMCYWNNLEWLEMLVFPTEVEMSGNFIYFLM